MIEKWREYCGGSRALAWLTLTEAAVWLAVTIVTLGGRLFHFDAGIESWLALPSGFATFLTRPWTLLTYMAVHFDVLHMLFNVLWLYWFGRILLTTLSDRHLLTYFIGGGVSGGVFFMCASAMGLGGGWLCGCSAAVIAVMCGAAIRTPDHIVRLFLIGDVRLKWVAAACCALTFLGGGGNQAAHVGGLVWGLATGLSLRYGVDLSSLAASPLAGKFKKEKGTKQRRRNPGRMIDILEQRRQDMERLDALLDKIKTSGYGSLSRKERAELNDLSQRIKK